MTETFSFNYSACEQYFKDHYIPYNKKIFINDQKCQCIDFIIPGAVVKIQSDSKLEYIKKWDDQIIKILKIIPENMPIYIYCSKMPSDNIIELLNEDYTNIVVIDKLEAIVPLIKDYYIVNTSLIASLASTLNQNYHNMNTSLQNINLFVTSEKYNLMTAFMYDEEIKRLNTFNIKIKNDIPSSAILITANEIKTSSTFNQWNPIGFDNIINKMEYPNLFQIIQLKYDCFKIGDKSPVRHIEGTTFICKSCQRICLIALKKDGGCAMCSS